MAVSARPGTSVQQPSETKLFKVGLELAEEDELVLVDDTVEEDVLVWTAELLEARKLDVDTGTKDVEFRIEELLDVERGIEEVVF